MPNVYIPQVPMRKTPVTQQLVPAMDLSACAEYGDPCVLLPSGYLNLDTAGVVAALYDKMKDFTDNDYVVPVGSPAAIAIVTSIAAQINNSRYKLLVWDRKILRYLKLTVDLNLPADAPNDREQARITFLRKLQAAQHV